jgi:DNA-binding MarR family transcriptional regulator
MNELLAALEADGLVERRPHPAHGRILPARLTEAGKTLLDAADARVTAIEAQMVADLDPQERRQLAQALECCVTALWP